MARDSVVLDSRGQPMKRAELLVERAGASITGVRSPMTNYPGDGLTPRRLAAILREADQGDPVRFLELAETIEERDPHLIGVLGTRKRSVSQLDITVEDASDAPEHQKHADMVRDWLKRDELTGELFDVLDAVHKGYSFTEIMWDTSEGEWQPKRLEWRDPRWFDFDRRDLRSPQLINEAGGREPLPGGQFIYAPMPAKSGIPTRGGLARVLAWAWMFKAFTNRDWAIFTQTYGQPIRVGKYGQGASKEDKDTLFRAVANIAGDCAAIIPESMKIEFQSADSVGASAALYKERADFFDQQTSKAVLGQTATTDAIAGGHAVGQEHRQVQEDIERADAKQLSALVNSDLIRIWIDLQYGPQKAYPKLRIGRPERKDVNMIVGAVERLRLPVKKAEIYAMLGLSEPDAGDEVLVARESGGEAGEPVPVAGRGKAPPAEKPDDDKQQALHARAAPALLDVDVIAGMGGDLAAGAADALVDAIGEIVRGAGSLDEVKDRLMAMAPEISTRDLSHAMRQALVLAQLTGRVDLLNG
jgi:phage gp29-like protein